MLTVNIWHFSIIYKLCNILIKKIQQRFLHHVCFCIVFWLFFGRFLIVFGSFFKCFWVVFDSFWDVFSRYFLSESNIDIVGAEQMFSFFGLKNFCSFYNLPIFWLWKKISERKLRKNEPTSRHITKYGALNRN